MSNKLSFTGFIEKHEGKVWSAYIRIPDEIISESNHWPNNRAVVTFNGVHQKYAALLSNAKGFKYLLISKRDLKVLHSHTNEPIHVSLLHDHSKYGMPVPEEWEKVELENPEIIPYFEQLTPGKKRSLLHLIGKYKSSDARMRKALAVAHHLLDSEGNLDFKQLNTMIKEYNNLSL